MSKHYLVVDDCNINRLVIKIILQKINNETKISEASDGCQVITLIKEGNTYDIIWIDLQMPDIDGIECTKKLREEHNYKGIIIGITAHADDETKEKCVAAGMTSMIAKPVNEAIIRKTINKFNTKS